MPVPRSGTAPSEQARISLPSGGRASQFSEDACELAAEPKELYVVPGANHVDPRTDLIPFGKLEEFFTKNMA
jgi:hypothetical protein